MKLKERILNRLKQSHRQNRLNGNPLDLGRLSAWHNPNRMKDKSKEEQI
jgi:hypothetical protein